jgi:hypothetical protein
MLTLIETIMCIVSFCIGNNYRDLTAASPPAGGSALTDAPVVQPALSKANVFTTLLLRATQHTTGLMVKVALLLPSRDLLSSQRQLRWTHTNRLAKGGQEVVASAASRCCASASAESTLWSFDLLVQHLFVT